MYTIVDLRDNKIKAKDEVYQLLLEVDNLEFHYNSFLYKDTLKTTLYSQSSTDSMRLFHENIQDVNEILDGISISEDSAYNSLLYDTQRLLSDYKDDFDELVSLYLYRGNEYNGLISELNSIENTVVEPLNVTYNFELLSVVLSLREHEKDYLLTHETQEIADFNSDLYRLKHDRVNNISNAEMRADIRKALQIGLEDYEKTMNALIELDDSIGLNEKSGKIRDIEKIIRPT